MRKILQKFGNFTIIWKFYKNLATIWNIWPQFDKFDHNLKNLTKIGQFFQIWPKCVFEPYFFLLSSSFFFLLLPLSLYRSEIYFDIFSKKLQIFEKHAKFATNWTFCSQMYIMLSNVNFLNFFKNFIFSKKNAKFATKWKCCSQIYIIALKCTFFDIFKKKTSNFQKQYQICHKINILLSNIHHALKMYILLHLKKFKFSKTCQICHKMKFCSQINVHLLHKFKIWNLPRRSRA